jgi:hypothetical protein
VHPMVTGFRASAERSNPIASEEAIQKYLGVQNTQIGACKRWRLSQVRRGESRRGKEAKVGWGGRVYGGGGRGGGAVMCVLLCMFLCVCATWL